MIYLTTGARSKPEYVRSMDNKFFFLFLLYFLFLIFVFYVQSLWLLSLMIDTTPYPVNNSIDILPLNSSLFHFLHMLIMEKKKRIGHFWMISSMNMTKNLLFRGFSFSSPIYTCPYSNSLSEQCIYYSFHGLYSNTSNKFKYSFSFSFFSVIFH